MKKIVSPNTIFRLLVALVLFSPGLLPGAKLLGQDAGITVSAQEASKSKKKTRKTPAMRERVYSQLAQAQKLADEGQVDEGLKVLERMRGRINQLNSYEKAMMWNFMGFIHYGNENIQQAQKAFKEVVNIKNIPESLELSTLYSLAQLNMQTENYAESLLMLDRWAALKGGDEPKSLVLRANANYAMKDYPKAIKAISRAVSDTEKSGKVAKEQWLVLQRALFYELKKTEQVTLVSEKLVRHYGSKAKYWVELSNMYGEIGETRKQLAVMEAAAQQGYVTKQSDIETLAQLYYFSGAPVKAATVMTEYLEKGILEKDLSTLRFLAQAWSTAKEHDKAIPVLQQAAALSKDGNMDARLAEVYLNLDLWQQAVEAATRAKDKGQLDNPGNVDVALGMANYNLKNYSSSIAYFKQARKQQSVRKMADQWLAYVEREKNKAEALKQTIAAVGN